VCCRVSSPDRGTRRARPFGEYGCDVPDTTVAFVLQAAAAQMKNNGAQVLLWTGDSPPHFLWTQTKEAVLNDTALVSAEIRAVLGAVDTVVPSIGNHESYPVNNFGPPPLQSWLYAQLAADWGPWLPPDAAANLSRAGYFAIRRPALVEGGKALKIISLQTNYCNNLAFFLYINDTDPGNQLRWLITELQVRS
jgi:sphingomyelin phosphodiesterase